MGRITQKEKYCLCKDWLINIPIINSSLILNQLHGFSGYKGKDFEYCPWCAEKLLVRLEK